MQSSSVGSPNPNNCTDQSSLRIRVFLNNYYERDAVRIEPSTHHINFWWSFYVNT